MQSPADTTSHHVDFRHAEIAHHVVAARCLTVRASCLEVEQGTGESLGCAAPKNGHPSHPPCLFRPPSEDCRLIPVSSTRFGVQGTHAQLWHGRSSRRVHSCSGGAALVMISRTELYRITSQVNNYLQVG